MTLTIGSLFSGIGGLELGLEWAGLGPVVWQVEQDDYCQRVLAQRWPKSHLCGDVRDAGCWANGSVVGDDRRLPQHNLAPVDVICGGFPCQDVSWANAGGEGLDGERSGLWREMHRIIREIRPRYVVVENVAALLHRGLGRVLGDLAGIGYDAEWSVVSACSVGAPHVRRRLFVVAYPDGEHGRAGLRDSAPRAIRSVQARHGAPDSRAGWRARLANPSALYGGADGVPDGPQRNHAIGNAVVPQVAEVVGRVILSLEANRLDGAA